MYNDFLETPGNGFKKQENTNFTKKFIVSCWTILFGPTGREEQNLLTSLLSVEINLFQNKNSLDEMLVSLFYCFLNPFPAKVGQKVKEEVKYSDKFNIYLHIREKRYSN